MNIFTNEELLADISGLNKTIDHLTAELEQVKADMKVAKFFDKSDSLTEESVRNTAEIKRLKAERDKSAKYLSVMFKKFETGDACYTDPDNYEDYLGNAVRLSDEQFAEIVDLLNKIDPQQALAGGEYD